MILSGGAGTRLWPLSREMYPKQLLALTGKHTMLQDTATRLAGIAGASAPIVVCNEAHRFTVAEQLRALGIRPRRILLEPAGRNTAPAVALAALQGAGDRSRGHRGRRAGGSRDPRCPQPFRQAADVAAGWRSDGKLVTFGIVAHAPETGYGYIRRGEGAGPAYPVAAVHRKAAARRGAAVRRLGRLLLEQRHVRVQGRALSWRSWQAFAPDILEASHGGVQGRQDGSGFRAHRQGRSSPSAAASRSIMP